MADKLTTKGWRDLGVAYLRCPSLFSPFGGQMVEVLLFKPRRWPFAVTYGLWWANYQLGLRTGTAARIGRRVAGTALQVVLIMLGVASRVAHWLRRR